MKKSKLIEMLNALPGDPDIKLWNGMVGDWMEVDPVLVEQVIVRETLEHWLEMCRLEECRDRNDWSYQMPAEKVERLTKNYTKVHSWDINDYVTPEDIKAKRYAQKKILLLQAKPKGVKTWDRVGSISY
jgi:hypothetical protein